MHTQLTALPTAQQTVSGVPRIPFGDWTESALEWVQDNLGTFFDRLHDLIESTVTGLSDLLNSPAPLVMVVVLAVLGALVAGWKVGLGSLVGLTVIIGLDQWEWAMQTLALVFVATLVALVIGVPLGVAAARWDGFSRAIRPVMDLMQTMPAFVWLVPVVTLFSIGPAGALVATVIFALPPGVRLTELGIRQVDPEVVEAGHAFGATPRQILRETQLPLALPTVMAGVNQVIMLALSMAVIAGLVGAGGLGGQVTSSIGMLDIGLGFEAGMSVVILAIFLDRVTGALGDTDRPGLVARLRNRARRSSAPSTGGGRSDDEGPEQEAEKARAAGPRRPATSV